MLRRRKFSTENRDEDEQDLETEKDSIVLTLNLDSTNLNPENTPKPDMVETSLLEEADSEIQVSKACIGAGVRCWREKYHH